MEAAAPAAYCRRSATGLPGAVFRFAHRVGFVTVTAVATTPLPHSAAQADAVDQPAPRPAPTTWKGILRQLGPGLIVSASIVGSGELIVTPKLGASEGFTLLWFIVIGCILKVFIQIELGRFTLARGTTTLQTLNRVPGPRVVVSWLLWLWLLMFLATVFQVAGMLGGLASILSIIGVPVSKKLLAIVIGLITAALLVVGRYRLVEGFSTVFVAAFTFCTIVAVGALQFTPFAITPQNLVEGFSFNLPVSFTIAFAAFGIIGVGASELIYYPYWCLEKGYARNVGPVQPTAEWGERARGWMRVLKIDAWVSCVIYTGATLAFYLLGAAVLHAQGLHVSNADVIPVLSQMYQQSLGTWSLWLFLIGAFAVLYSTIFVASASNARLIADALEVFRIRRYASNIERQRDVTRMCAIVPAAWVILYLIWDSPVTLVFVGAVAQGLMIPFLALAALWLNHRQTEPALQPGTMWRAWLWVSAACMVIVGAYQVVSELGRLLG
jgi:manganese transport protein